MQLNNWSIVLIILGALVLAYMAAGTVVAIKATEALDEIEKTAELQAGGVTTEQIKKARRRG